LDDVAVERQIAVGKALVREARLSWHRRGIEALTARIEITEYAEVERHRPESRPDAAIDIDLCGSAVRKRDAGGAGADIQLQVGRHVVARLEIGADRRLTVGLGDAAETVVAGDGGAEGKIPRR